MLSAFSSKASISDGMGVHRCLRYGQLACFGRHYECWKVYKGLEQHMLPSRWCLFQQDNAKPHTAANTTAWLRSRRVRVLNWLACSPDLSPIENIWCIIKWKICQDDHKLFSGWKPISGKNGPNSNTKIPETHNLKAQTSSNCFEKKRGCYTMVNMPLSRPVAGIEFEIS